MRDGSQSDPIMGLATHRKSGCAGRVTFRAPIRPAYGPCGGRAPPGLARPRGGATAPPESFSKIVLASPSEFPYSTSTHGGVAQLGERLTGSQEVRGSIPLVSTRALNEAPTQVGAFFHIGTQGQRRHHRSSWSTRSKKASARASSLAARPSRSTPASASRSWAPTAPAKPPCSKSSWASTVPMPARSSTPRTAR